MTITTPPPAYSAQPAKEDTPQMNTNVDGRTPIKAKQQKLGCDVCTVPCEACSDFLNNKKPSSEQGLSDDERPHCCSGACGSPTT
ncbi:hypothetical protein HDV04_002851, partial [Boothiomyces sp. JEL0838]